MELFYGVELSGFGFACLALASSIVTGLAAYGLYKPARRVGFVSKGRADRFGAGGTPLVGGPALLLGMIVPFVGLRIWPSPALALAAVGFFAVGLADDWFDWRPGPKFFAQVVIAGAVAYISAPSAGMIGLALLIYLFLVNACNYIDNMDGVLPGVALAQAFAIVQFSLVSGDAGVLLVCTLPAVLFLSTPPARIYLGDSGSHLIGALFAVDVVQTLMRSDGFHARFILPFLVLFAVQIADVVTVTVARRRAGRPLLKGDTNHLSHRLVSQGFTVSRALLVLVLASAVCGVASLLLVHSS